jgi:Double-GTPase 1
MGNICVIGPQSSGKTTYLAALTQWSSLAKGINQKKYDIEAIGEDAEKLAGKAKSIIYQGASLEPTTVAGGIYQMPSYMFRIQVRQQLRKQPPIDLVVKDYAGEIFKGLATGTVPADHQDFLDDCLRNDVSGCLLLLTEWQKGTDLFYEQAMETFIRMMKTNDRLSNYRLAVAMSKCERGELWPGRLEPEVDLFNVHLPRMTGLLRRKIPKQNLDFFAVSTFGVLERNDPRPNRIDEMGKERTKSVLRKPSAWQPYGLVAPINWLSRKG